jgi:hypothetical protein
MLTFEVANVNIRNQKIQLLLLHTMYICVILIIEFIKVTNIATRRGVKKDEKDSR